MTPKIRIASRSVCSLLLAGAMVAPIPARAHTFGAAAAIVDRAPARERRGHLEVDASALGASADVIVTQLNDAVKDLFKREAVRVTDDPNDPVIKIIIVPLQGDTAGYRISYSVLRAGSTLQGSTGRSDCRLCTESELVEAALAGVELTVEYLEVEAEPTGTIATDPSPSGCASDADCATAQTCDADQGVCIDRPIVEGDDRQRKLGAMGYAGIALIVVGAAGLGTGIALALKKPTPSDDEPTKQVSTKKPGYGVLAAGGVVAVAGIVLLVLDLKRGKSERVAVTPWIPIDRSQPGGLAVSGRF